MKIEENLLIDRIVSFTRYESIVCTSKIPDDAPIFKNHFPGSPILPGVILIEAMAQASGFIHMLSYDFSKMLYLATVKNVKFREFVCPGQSVKITSSLCRTGEGYVYCKSQVRNLEGSSLANGELILALSDFPNASLRDHLIKNINMALINCE